MDQELQDTITATESIEDPQVRLRVAIEAVRQHNTRHKTDDLLRISNSVGNTRKNRGNAA